jgi:hypothetical protein
MSFYTKKSFRARGCGAISLSCIMLATTPEQTFARINVKLIARVRQRKKEKKLNMKPQQIKKAPSSKHRVLILYKILFSFRNR